MSHTPESVAPQVATLREIAEGAGRDPSAVSVTVMAEPGHGTDIDLDGFAAAGVDRLIVNPWRRSREALDWLPTFADWAGLTPAPA